MKVDPFTLKVCEELFGCFLSPMRDEYGVRRYECACCDKPISIHAWVHASHKRGCIIPTVRRYLAKHKPICVPPKQPFTTSGTTR